jgi:plasmid stabilization system protein ParE
MPKEIIWSPLAENDLDVVIEYLQNNWTNNVAAAFLDKLYQYLEMTLLNPKQFPLVYKKRHYRKCVITKHHTLYYK